MPVYQWWAKWGGTLLLRSFVRLPCVFWLRQWARVRKRGCGVEVTELSTNKQHTLSNWSTYGFIVDQRRNRLSVDRDRKLVYAHFNVRLLRKVRDVDCNSQYFAWEVEEVEVESESEEDLVVGQDEMDDSEDLD